MPIAKLQYTDKEIYGKNFSGEQLMEKLSFTHIIEFLKIDQDTKRRFYELQALKNNWSVRDLQRAINSMLYERTGLSTNKDAVLGKSIKEEKPRSNEVFRSPYILEFLGLKEDSEYSETDLEQAIIDHLQRFLMEMGQGLAIFLFISTFPL